MADKLRVFVSIEVPQGAKRLLGEVSQALRQRGVEDVRWVQPQGIHLTLKFLGDVDAFQTQSLMTVLQDTARTARPFTLSLSKLGVFPNPQSPRVVWVGLRGDLETLAVLQKSLESRFKSLGFPPETRPFTPHLTLGRIRRNPPFKGDGTLAKALEEGTEIESTWTVKEIRLIQSTLSPQGALYTTLGTASFLTTGGGPWTPEP